MTQDKIYYIILDMDAKKWSSQLSIACSLLTIWTSKPDLKLKFNIICDFENLEQKIEKKEIKVPEISRSKNENN